jgi:hypothetical protein
VVKLFRAIPEQFQVKLNYSQLLVVAAVDRQVMTAVAVAVQVVYFILLD